MSGRIAAAIGVLVLLPVLVGPIVVGVVLDRQIRAELAVRPDLPFVLEYERGLYTSTARTIFSLAEMAGDPDLESATLVIDHTIVHGPVPLAAPAIGRSPLDLVVVWVRSSISVDPESMPRVARALAGAPVARLDTRVTFDRRIDLDLDAPAFAFDDDRFVWKGLTGEAALSPTSRSGEGRLEIRGIEAFDGETAIDVAPVVAVFEVDLERLRLETVLDQQGIELESAEGRVAFGPVHVESEAPLVQDTFGPSEASATLASISGGGRLGEPGFLVDGLAYGQVISLDEDNGLHRGEVRFGFEQSRWGTRPADGPGSFSIVVDRIDRDAVLRLRDALQALEASGASPEQIQAMRPFTVLEHLPAVLASSPSFDVRDLVYQAPEGRLEGALHVSVDGSQPELLADPFGLMGQIEAKLRLDAPEALLRRLLAPLAQARVEEATADVTEAPLVDESDGLEATNGSELVHPVDAWLADGTLVREGDRLVLDARFENGFPMLNGQPADPALMMQMMPGM